MAIVKNTSEGIATVALGLDWKPGDKVIVPAPNTVEMAEERVKAGYECVDWYLCRRSL